MIANILAGRRQRRIKSFSARGRCPRMQLPFGRLHRNADQIQVFIVVRLESQYRPISFTLFSECRSREPIRTAPSCLEQLTALDVGYNAVRDG
nr:hypothetical protein [Pseudomonas caspiana]